MASTMITLGGANLDDGVQPWLEAVGLGEWCDVFKDKLGLDHIDDLGVSPSRLAVPTWVGAHVRIGGMLRG